MPGRRPFRTLRRPGRLPGTAVVVLVVLAVAVLLLGPALGPGTVARYDLSIVTGRPWSGQLLGLGADPPRAVPSDLVLWLLGFVLPDAWLLAILLLALLVTGGLGAARWAGSVAGRCAAATAYVWSAYLAERLGLGQWALLVGWALAPWAAYAARRLALPPPGPAASGPAAGEPGQVRVVPLARLALLVALGGLGGAPALVIVAGPALAVTLAGRSGRRLLPFVTVLAVGAVKALPWALPALLRPGGTPGSALGARVFAARADTPAGTVASVLSGGGIWNLDVVPPGRATWLGALLALAVALVGAGGLLALARRDRARAALLAAGVVGLVGTFLLSSRAGVWAQVHVPGVAVLRDPARLVAWWVLATSAGLGAVGDRLAARRQLAAAGWVPAACVIVVLAPLAVLPRAALGLGGALRAVTPSPDDRVAAQRADRVAHGAAVLVLPWSAYRAPGWNGGRPVLDPLPRHLASRVLASGDLPVRVDGRVTVVTGESVPGRLVARALQRAGRPDGGPLLPLLRSLGVGAVLVEGEPLSRDPAAVPSRALAGLSRVGSAGSVDVYAVPGPLAPPLDDYLPPAVPVVAADVGVAALLVVLVALALRPVRPARPLRSAGSPGSPRTAGPTS